jgi:hypothetical protein
MKIPSSPNLVPPGGWSYKDPDSGVPFKEAHVEALLSMVRRHRIANDLRVGGEWTQEFWDNLCTQNPKAPCSDADSPERPLNADDISAFLTTLVAQRESGKQQVSQEVYDKRIEVCLACPKLTHVGCSSCGAFGRLLHRVVAGIRVPNDVAPGKSCGVCGCVVSAKAAYDIDVLKAVDAELGRNPPYHESCWMLGHV